MKHDPVRHRVPFWEIQRYLETGELGPVMRAYKARDEVRGRRSGNILGWPAPGPDGCGEGNHWVSKQRPGDE